MSPRRFLPSLAKCVQLAAFAVSWLPFQAASAESPPSPPTLSDPRVPSAYCRTARARAASDAALLMTPSLVVQGIRFPTNNSVLTDTGPTAGRGYQVRAGLSFSPLDFYRGLRTMKVGDSDCSRHDASEKVDEGLAHGADGARLTALREQTVYLDAHRSDWQALRVKAEERLAARVITLIDIDDLRRYSDDLERKFVDVHGEVNQLLAQGTTRDAVPLGTLADQYARETVHFERETSTLRSLEPWQLQLTGGVIPESPVDWYGIAQLSLNFGTFARNRQEGLFVDARVDELRHASYEVDTKVREYRERVVASLGQARGELAVVDRELSFVTTTRAALERSDAQNIANARDTLAIEEFSAESDRVFLRAWIVALTALLENWHG